MRLPCKGKIKLEDAIPKITVKVITVLGAIAVAVLFFFSLIFAIASVYDPARLATSAILFIAAIAIAYYITRKPKTVIQRLEISGQMKAAPIKCPNCSASVDANQIKIVSGVPYATCPYCGNTFEVTEEPKW
jgi:DNA-directed RNA polymerase subunit RPC12/RpoP